MRRKFPQWIIGVDEVGRGPLAGPVVVAGIRIKNRRRAMKVLDGIRDSKKLSAKKREVWFSRLTAHPDIEYAVARVYPKIIDRINIAQAANLAARRVHSRLSLENPSINEVLLDAGLALPQHILHTAIIKGDEKIPVIAAASIIAKVTRDRYMRRLHKKYPQYRFDLHKGYGTRFHREMIRQFGQCEIHRKSFQLH